MKRETNLDHIMRAQARAMKSRSSKAIGIGACGPAGCGVDYPAEYDVDFLECYYTVLPQAALAVAGQTAFTLTFNPVDQYFTPYAVSVVVRDSADPSLPRVANFGSVSIDGCRYAGTNTAPLTAASTQFWTSEAWTANGNCRACPVRWGCFSNAALGTPLVVQGFNPHPAGIPVDVIMQVYGRGGSMLPSWCTDDRGSWRIPPVAPNPNAGGFTSTPRRGGILGGGSIP